MGGDGKLGFGIVIGRSDNGLDRRQAFVAMICERSGMYQPRLRNFKRDDTRSRKCECPFKLRGYHMGDETWKFNMISEERELVLDMTLKMVSLKNILATLKRKKSLNVSNIKKIYNAHA
ncbi:uncharacterized protein LOC127094282 [Lathyrus oleraceus]|uniref:uncharacterized protein LOC127094282 n=1 Tax=Pisum sativum TaxID=3888 RepID=UPI0021D0ED5E|nr:uncharacterized protein LOC127094282 [Pisum sativum]